MQNEFFSEENKGQLNMVCCTHFTGKDLSFSVSLYSTIFWAVKEMATGLSSKADGKQ